jgi:hypothetical protein
MSQISITLTPDERKIILNEVREAFIKSNLSTLDKTKYSFKVARYISSEYMHFYEEFINALFSVTEYLYKDCQVASKDGIKAAMGNKRYHNLEDWELEQYYRWLDGEDIFEELKVGFFDDNFVEEEIEEMIEYVLSET